MFLKFLKIVETFKKDDISGRAEWSTPIVGIKMLVKKK